MGDLKWDWSIEYQCYPSSSMVRPDTEKVPTNISDSINNKDTTLDIQLGQREQIRIGDGQTTNKFYRNKHTEQRAKLSDEQNKFILGLQKSPQKTGIESHQDIDTATEDLGDPFLFDDSIQQPSRSIPTSPKDKTSISKLSRYLICLKINNT